MTRCISKSSYRCQYIQVDKPYEAATRAASTRTGNIFGSNSSVREQSAVRREHSLFANHPSCLQINQASILILSSPRDSIVMQPQRTSTCGQKSGTRSRAFSERFLLRDAASREDDRTRRRGRAGAYSYGIRDEGEDSEGQAEPIGSRRPTMGDRTDLPRPPTTVAPSRTSRGSTSTRTA